MSVDTDISRTSRLSFLESFFADGDFYRRHSRSAPVYISLSVVHNDSGRAKDPTSRLFEEFDCSKTVLW